MHPSPRQANSSLIQASTPQTPTASQIRSSQNHARASPVSRKSSNSTSSPSLTVSAATIVPTSASNSASAAHSSSASGCKQCNCKNSRCLKLYCVCFAAGVFCTDCNCRSCLNTEAHRKERDEARQATIERNPRAFQPKITPQMVPQTPQQQSQPTPAANPPSANTVAVDGSASPAVRAVHFRGCHCRKSRCLKKYCECYQAGVYCGENCKCQDCSNFEGSAERKQLEVKGAVSVPSSAHSHSIDQNNGHVQLDHKRATPTSSPAPNKRGGNAAATSSTGSSSSSSSSKVFTFQQKSPQASPMHSAMEVEATKELSEALLLAAARESENEKEENAMAESSEDGVSSSREDGVSANAEILLQLAQSAGSPPARPGEPNARLLSVNVNAAEEEAQTLKRARFHAPPNTVPTERMRAALSSASVHNGGALNSSTMLRFGSPLPSYARSPSGLNSTLSSSSTSSARAIFPASLSPSFHSKRVTLSTPLGVSAALTSAALSSSPRASIISSPLSASISTLTSSIISHSTLPPHPSPPNSLPLRSTRNISFEQRPIGPTPTHVRSPSPPAAFAMSPLTVNASPSHAANAAFPAASTLSVSLSPLPAHSSSTSILSLNPLASSSSSSTIHSTSPPLPPLHPQPISNAPSILNSPAVRAQQPHVSSSTSLLLPPSPAPGSKRRFDALQASSAESQLTSPAVKIESESSATPAAHSKSPPVPFSSATAYHAERPSEDLKSSSAVLKEEAVRGDGMVVEAKELATTLQASSASASVSMKLESNSEDESRHVDGIDHWREPEESVSTTPAASATHAHSISIALPPAAGASSSLPSPLFLNDRLLANSRREGVMLKTMNGFFENVLQRVAASAETK